MLKDKTNMTCWT